MEESERMTHFIKENEELKAEVKRLRTEIEKTKHEMWDRHTEDALALIRQRDVAQQWAKHNYSLFKRCNEVKRHIREQRDEARASLAEEQRLNAMGSERQARLMARVEEGRREIERLRAESISLKERDRLLAQVRAGYEEQLAKMRAALEEIITISMRGGGDYEEVARQALSGTGPAYPSGYKTEICQVGNNPLMEALRAARETLHRYSITKLFVDEGRATVVVHGVRTIPLYANETWELGDHASEALALIDAVIVKKER